MLHCGVRRERPVAGPEANYGYHAGFSSEVLVRYNHFGTVTGW